MPKGHILIIDDDPSSRELMVQFFDSHGCRTVTAENGRDGIEKLSKGPFDIIFLDLNMPVMGGLEALPILRDRAYTTRIVITTAFASYDSKLEGRQHGVQDYLVKPITLSKLQEIVAKYLPDRPEEADDITEDGLINLGLDLTQLDHTVARLIPERIAREFFVIPVGLHQNTMTIAMANASNKDVIQRLRNETGYDILTIYADQKDILEAIRLAYSVTPGTPPSPSSPTITPAPSGTASPPSDSQPASSVPAKDISLPKRFAEAISYASSEQAGGLRFTPWPDRVDVQTRTHGKERKYATWTREDYAALLKALSSSPSSEGYASPLHSIRVADARLDYRIHRLPTINGDSLLVDFQPGRGRLPELSDLDLSPKVSEGLLNAISSRRNTILLAGMPETEQKSVACAIMREMIVPDTCFISIEYDAFGPIEGIIQTILRPGTGQTHANALRSALLHRPDILALDHIPDRETADLFLNATGPTRPGLGGVLAADAVSALTGLVRMGCAPSLISRAVSYVMACRWLRKICPECRISGPPPDAVVKGVTAAGLPLPDVWHTGEGCPGCDHTGFSRYTPVYEGLPLSPAIRRTLLDGADEHAMRNAARDAGYPTLLAAGLEKVREGMIAPDELLQLLPDPG